MMSSDNLSSENPIVRDFIHSYPFDLDPFQIEAAEVIASGRGVLVCAPTGSGKTIVGEFAIHSALQAEKRCFYTTPIKALSNQKYHELCEKYGSEQVGLLTGDMSLNADASIVVMTTEVLRNMIYAQSERLEDLSHVVMDEVHYLADKSRGAVWEEAILNLAPEVIIVSLSATVSNAEEFGQWLSTVRGDTPVIVTQHRPIPLHHHIMVGRRILDLFHEDGSPHGRVAEFIARAEAVGGRGAARRVDVVQSLKSAQLLPAIYFIFSRAGCDGAVKQLLTSNIDLTTPQEKKKIDQVLQEYIVDIPEEDLLILGYKHFRRALRSGFAAHHAGMLPAFRHVVEKLFAEGLVRLCFATETLALGINMPARSVVLEKLVKFNGEAHVDLTPGQYTQLTGRAGRRGRDTEGHAIVLWNSRVDVDDLIRLASTQSYPLDSTFRPGYNMTANLIATKGYSEAHAILDRSFAQYQVDGSVVERAAEIRHLEQHRDREKERVYALLGEHEISQDLEESFSLLLEFAELRRQLNKAERSMKTRVQERIRRETAGILRSLHVGDVLALPTGKNPDVVVIARSDSGPDPRPTIIAEDGWCGRISAELFQNIPQPIGHIKLHRGVEKAPKKSARSVGAQLRRAALDRPKRLRPRARAGGEEYILVEKLRQELNTHPVDSWLGREELVRAALDALKAQRKLDFFLQGHELGSDTLGSILDRIIALLMELDYIETTVETTDSVGDTGDAEDRDYSSDWESLRLTLEGERLIGIHHESDLLIAQCLRRGIWDQLDPAELAAAVSCCIFESRRHTGGELVEHHAPTSALAQSFIHMTRIYGELVSDEQRHQLPITREPDSRFATAIHQWTAGAPLEYCLTAAQTHGVILTPGDFVRWCRQVIDLLGQITRTGYSDSVRASARQAMKAIERGVVDN